MQAKIIMIPTLCGTYALYGRLRSLQLEIIHHQKIICRCCHTNVRISIFSEESIIANRFLPLGRRNTHIILLPIRKILCHPIEIQDGREPLGGINTSKIRTTVGQSEIDGCSSYVLILPNVFFNFTNISNCVY